MDQVKISARRPVSLIAWFAASDPFFTLIFNFITAAVLENIRITFTFISSWHKTQTHADSRPHFVFKSCLGSFIFVFFAQVRVYEKESSN